MPITKPFKVALAGKKMSAEAYNAIVRLFEEGQYKDINLGGSNAFVDADDIENFPEINFHQFDQGNIRPQIANWIKSLRNDGFFPQGKDDEINEIARTIVSTINVPKAKQHAASQNILKSLGTQGLKDPKIQESESLSPAAVSPQQTEVKVSAGESKKGATSLIDKLKKTLRQQDPANKIQGTIEGIDVLKTIDLSDAELVTLNLFIDNLPALQNDQLATIVVPNDINSEKLIKAQLIIQNVYTAAYFAYAMDTSEYGPTAVSSATIGKPAQPSVSGIVDPDAASSPAAIAPAPTLPEVKSPAAESADELQMSVSATEASSPDQPALDVHEAESPAPATESPAAASDAPEPASPQPAEAKAQANSSQLPETKLPFPAEVPAPVAEPGEPIAASPIETQAQAEPVSDPTESRESDTAHEDKLPAPEAKQPTLVDQPTGAPFMSQSQFNPKEPENDELEQSQSPATETKGDAKSPDSPSPAAFDDLHEDIVQSIWREAPPQYNYGDLKQSLSSSTAKAWIKAQDPHKNAENIKDNLVRILNNGVIAELFVRGTDLQKIQEELGKKDPVNTSSLASDLFELIEKARQKNSPEEIDAAKLAKGLKIKLDTNLVQEIRGDWERYTNIMKTINTYRTEFEAAEDKIKTLHQTITHATKHAEAQASLGALQKQLSIAISQKQQAKKEFKDAREIPKKKYATTRDITPPKTFIKIKNSLNEFLTKDEKHITELDTKLKALQKMAREAETNVKKLADAQAKIEKEAKKAADAKAKEELTKNYNNAKERFVNALTDSFTHHQILPREEDKAIASNQGFDQARIEGYKQEIRTAIRQWVHDNSKAFANPSDLHGYVQVFESRNNFNEINGYLSQRFPKTYKTLEKTLQKIGNRAQKDREAALAGAKKQKDQTSKETKQPPGDQKVSESDAKQAGKVDEDQEPEEQGKKNDAGFSDLDQAKEAFLEALTTSYKKFVLTPTPEILDTIKGYGYDEKTIAAHSEHFKVELRKHFLTHESLNSDDNNIEFFESWTNYVKSLRNNTELDAVFEDEEAFLEAYTAAQPYLAAAAQAGIAKLEAAKAAATSAKDKESRSVANRELADAFFDKFELKKPFGMDDYGYSATSGAFAKLHKAALEKVKSLNLSTHDAAKAKDALDDEESLDEKVETALSDLLSEQKDTKDQAEKEYNVATHLQQISGRLTLPEAAKIEFLNKYKDLLCYTQPDQKRGGGVIDRDPAEVATALSEVLRDKSTDKASIKQTLSDAGLELNDQAYEDLARYNGGKFAPPPLPKTLPPSIPPQTPTPPLSFKDAEDSMKKAKAMLSGTNHTKLDSALDALSVDAKLARSNEEKRTALRKEFKEYKLDDKLNDLQARITELQTLQKELTQFRAYLQTNNLTTPKDAKERKFLLPLHLSPENIRSLGLTAENTVLGALKQQVEKRKAELAKERDDYKKEFGDTIGKGRKKYTNVLAEKAEKARQALENAKNPEEEIAALGTRFNKTLLEATEEAKIAKAVAGNIFGLCDDLNARLTELAKTRDKFVNLKEAIATDEEMNHFLKTPAYQATYSAPSSTTRLKTGEIAVEATTHIATTTHGDVSANTAAKEQVLKAIGANSGLPSPQVTLAPDQNLKSINVKETDKVHYYALNHSKEGLCDSRSKPIDDVKSAISVTHAASTVKLEVLKTAGNLDQAQLLTSITGQLTSRSGLNPLYLLAKDVDVSDPAARNDAYYEMWNQMLKAYPKPTYDNMVDFLTMRKHQLGGLNQMGSLFSTPTDYAKALFAVYKDQLLNAEVLAAKDWVDKYRAHGGAGAIYLDGSNAQTVYHTKCYLEAMKVLGPMLGEKDAAKRYEWTGGTKPDEADIKKAIYALSKQRYEKQLKVDYEVAYKTDKDLGMEYRLSKGKVATTGERAEEVANQTSRFTKK